VDNFRAQLSNRWESHLLGEVRPSTFIWTPEGAERLLAAAITSRLTQRVGSFGRLLCPRESRPIAFGGQTTRRRPGESPGAASIGFARPRVEEDSRALPVFDLIAAA
jgi:hypothetical protein